MRADVDLIRRGRNTCVTASVPMTLPPVTSATRADDAASAGDEGTVMVFSSAAACDLLAHELAKAPHEEPARWRSRMSGTSTKGKYF
jgi:hypothetical protein